MAYTLFDHVSIGGENTFKTWTQGLQKQQRAKLNQKLDLLESVGPDLPPNLLSDSGVVPIKKLKVRGNVQLRPMLCEGPVTVGKEYTLLIGATEKGDKLVPANVRELAVALRTEIIKAPGARRCLHERVV